MNRVAAAGMAAILVASALTACSSGNNKPSETQAPEQTEAEKETAAPEQTEAEKETAAPVADNGELKEVYVFIRERGDLSFWDSMAEGADRSVTDYADRANVHVVETTADLQANLQAMYEAADTGADLIITYTEFKDNLVEVANDLTSISLSSARMYLIECENGNVYGVDFATSQAAYLGGIVAADLAKSGVIGFIGGMDEALVIQEFLWGYIQGAKAYNPDIKIVSNYVGGWNDPDTAKTQAMTQYNDAKADVIFACAGGSGNGVHNAAGETGKYVIGVDSDQSLLYADDKTIQSRFATSVVKEVGNVVYNVIGEWLDNDGELPYGEYKILGIDDGAVGIVEGDVLNGLLSDEGKAALEAAKAGIADGSIEVKSALGKSQDEVKAFINENCQ